MMEGYRAVKDFARSGWRLTLPGGPAGGHYKGFTHTESRGTDILPNDQYEQDREDGMSAHDSAHASRRNPRGVYRSAAEVPPRPNASGHSHTYRGYQTEHQPGQSVAPGSFPADFFETMEDAFLSGLGIVTPRMVINGNDPVWPGPMPMWRPPQLPAPVNTVGVRPILVQTCDRMAPPPAGCTYQLHATDADPCAATLICPPPSSGATSVVNQPPASPLPLPPAPSIPVYTAPPVSPAPAPTVPTNQVVPLNDGSGNYRNLSTGAIVPASAVTQNLATMQLTASGAASSALSWLEQNTIFAAVPNWAVVGGGLLLASMLFKGKR